MRQKNDTKKEKRRERRIKQTERTELTSPLTVEENCVREHVSAGEKTDRGSLSATARTHRKNERFCKFVKTKEKLGKGGTYFTVIRNSEGDLSNVFQKNIASTDVM